jgi:PAS domain S-box-containing protein
MNIFEEIRSSADGLAEKWLAALGVKHEAGAAVDHRARAVVELLEPLAKNGSGGDESGGVIRDASAVNWSSERYRACRELFPADDARIFSSRLDVLLEVLKAAVNESEAGGEEKKRATDLLDKYFQALMSGLSSATSPARENRLVEIVKTNKLLQSLFQSSRNAVFFLDHELRILDANASSEEIFGRPAEKAAGMNYRLLLAADERDSLEEAAQKLDADQSWSGEVRAVRAGLEEFPAEAALSRVELEEGVFIYQLIVSDRSEVEDLRRELERKQEHVKEMSVTLKNVIRSVDEDKRDFMDGLAHHVEIELMPALEKMSRADSSQIRGDYREVIEDQLRDLAAGASGRLNKLLMELTPTEIQICKYIQTGHGTKEIAEMMNSSFETVQTHRKNIRKKLDLTGRRVSLSSFLKNLPESE